MVGAMPFEAGGTERRWSWGWFAASTLTFTIAGAAACLAAYVASTPPIEIDTSAPRQTLFSDDFKTDPATSGRWTVQRWNNEVHTKEPEDAAYHADGVFYLTRGRAYCGMSMFARTELKATRWRARFRFRADAKERLANGFVFAFYKEPPKEHNTMVGSNLAFEGTSGYGLYFDTYAGDRPDQRSISLVKDSVSRPLAKVRDARVGDRKWHAVDVRFDDGRVTVFLDGERVLEHAIQRLDTSRTGFGFTAAVGAALTDHAIDDFVLTR